MNAQKTCLLSDLPPGCRAKVSKVEGTGTITNRLLALGFTPDADVEVMECGCGRQIVKVRGCNLVLDGEVTCRVACELQPVPSPADAEDVRCDGKRRMRRKRLRSLLWNKIL